MNKLFKGAVAGAAGVALLLGGAGTFALWNDVAGWGTTATVASGNLRFDTVAPGQWKLNGSPITPEALSAAHVVPGDELTYEVSDVRYHATGDNLAAKLGVTFGAGADGDAALLNALDPQITIGTNTWNLGNQGTLTVPITPGPDTQSLGAVTISMVFGADDTTAQDEMVNVAGMQLTLQQTDTGYNVDNS